MSNQTPLSANTFRWAGIFYLIVFVFGLTSEMALRMPVIVSGDAAATAANILNSGGAFQLSMAADLVMVLSDVALAILLLVIFLPVSRTAAAVATGFRLIQAAIIGINLVNLFAGTMLVLHPETLTGFGVDQSNALALMFIEFHGAGYDLGMFFFAMACLVLGWLIVKAEFAPNALGIAVAVSGLIYLAGSATVFFAPGWNEAVSYLYVIPVISELWFALWLLTRGFRSGVTRAATA